MNAMEDMPIFIHNDFEVVDDITTRCNNIRPSSGDVPVIVVQYPQWKYETSCFLDKVWYYFSALLKRAKNLRFVQHGREYCILLADEVLGRSFSVHIRHETAPAARHFRIHLSLLTSKERKRVEDFSEAERLSMQMALMEVFDLVDEAARQVDFSINTRWSVIERGASMADAVVDRFYTCSSYTDESGTIHGVSKITHSVSLPSSSSSPPRREGDEDEEKMPPLITEKREKEITTPSLTLFKRLTEHLEVLLRTPHWFAWPHNERVGLLVVMVEKIENFVWGNTPGSNYLTPNWSLLHRPQFLDLWRLQSRMVQRDFLRYMGRQYSPRGPHVVFCLWSRPKAETDSLSQPKTETTTYSSTSAGLLKIQGPKVGDTLVLQTYCEMPGHWHPSGEPERLLVIKDKEQLEQVRLLLLKLYSFLSLMERILMATSEGWGQAHAERKRSQIGFAQLVQWFRHKRHDFAGEITHLNLTALMKLFGVPGADARPSDTLATGEFYYHCPGPAARDHCTATYSLGPDDRNFFERPFFK